MLTTCSTTELHPWPMVNTLKSQRLILKYLKYEIEIAQCIEYTKRVELQS